MNRWRVLLVVMIIALASAATLRHYIRSKEKKNREAAYQSALQAYSQNLKPGLTRKEVEDYFLSQGTRFRRMCCVDADRGARRFSKDRRRGRSLVLQRTYVRR